MKVAGAPLACLACLDGFFDKGTGELLGGPIWGGILSRQGNRHASGHLNVSKAGQTGQNALDGWVLPLDLDGLDGFLDIGAEGDRFGAFLAVLTFTNRHGIDLILQKPSKPSTGSPPPGPPPTAC